MQTGAPFRLCGPETPLSPIVVSVPPAGRDYPPAFATLARLPAAQVRSLEDRYVDALVPDDARAIVAATARAWIDLNRSERDFDPAMVRGGHALGAMPGAKVRGGLGLIPRRLTHGGEIWRGPISAAHFNERIEHHHRPFHVALASLLIEALARFGVAVLVDLHSMPRLPQDEPPRFVIGDLFGRSAQARFAQTAIEVLGAGGAKVALNTPYAGGHILERHARPYRGVHGLQLEVDRELYLNANGDRPAAGAKSVKAQIAALLVALADEALAVPHTQAAE